MDSAPPLRVGLVGIGVGARQLLPALTTGRHVKLTAVADVRPAALDQVARDFGTETFISVEELAESPNVEAVWVATPNHLHAGHAIAALERGKHVIVSKPMAISLAETAQMNAAADRNGALLLAGHTQSMAPTIREMARMVRDGELGKLGMLHTWHFTDWMYRPRLPAELDVSQGGGPVFRQASHQVDIVRSIAGRPVRSVRAMVVQLDSSRGAPGAYSAYLEFDDGTPATIVYSGYGGFAMEELLRGEAARSRPAAPPKQNETEAKEALRYAGGEAAQTRNSLGLFGLTLVTCERGDLRESPDGLYLYQHGERHHIAVPDEPRGAAELEELYQAVRNGQALHHDGRWGEATLEVCLAIHESARTRAEVRL
jgi:predicted dehydrogenase